MSRLVVAVIALITVAAGAFSASAASAQVSVIAVNSPAVADGATTVAIEVRLSAMVAAVDGRLLYDTNAAQLIGVAPVGAGTSLSPQEVTGGAAFGAYDLVAKNSRTTLRLVLAANRPGKIDFQVLIDSAADGSGNRLSVTGAEVSRTIRVGNGTTRYAAPSQSTHPAPARPAGATRDLIADGTIGKLDLDVVRSGWAFTRANTGSCNATTADGDANGDGCVDIVDLQALSAAQGRQTAQPVNGGQTSDSVRASSLTNGIDTRFTASAGGPTSAGAGASAVGSNLIFVVSSGSDTPDAAAGDGLCADSLGRCTLRAAITESNWQIGSNRIEFNLPGPAPAVIQLGSSPISIIQDRSGGTFIDGYTQPGSQVNTATVGSNAVPGVELRGTGDSPRAWNLFITSANNTVRGILFNNVYRGIYLDRVDAHDNTIVGNFFGYNANGSVHSYTSYDGVIINAGANHNRIGGPALADRNIARATKALYLYGPGTDYNVLQNNVLCMTPNGMAVATCSTGIDDDFGPKHSLVGGTGPGERNIIGPTLLQGVEYSHGWDPAGQDTSDKWNNSYNQVIGNWIGFRGDGSYDVAFRSGLNDPGSADNGNGVNVYDGSNYNLIEGNWVSSAYDGIQTMSPNSTGNTIRGNIIGESPLGTPAPVGRDGIVVRLNTRTHTVEGNIIKNVGRYGIALLQWDVIWIKLSKNIITDMTGPAIYLIPNPSDPTTGANILLASPTITAATTLLVSGTGIPSATVELYRASRPAGQSGLPSEYLGSGVVADDGSWSIPVTTIAAGDGVTALQIATSGNTSALSLNVAAAFEQPPAAPVADFNWNQLTGTLDVAFTDTSTGTPAAWSWNFGDGNTSTQQSPSHTYALPGDYTVTLTATNAGGSDQTQKQITVAPVVAAFFAADAWQRTLADAWGSADIGGAYTLQGNATNYDVANGVGTILVPSAGATRSARLNNVNERNVSIKFRVAANKVAATRNMFVYAVARRNGNNEYRPRLIFNANGTVSVNGSVVINGSESPLGAAALVPGLTQAPGSYIWFRAEVTGNDPTTIRVKAWADGQSEPSGWNFTATNGQAAVQGPGAVGLRLYVTTGSTNAPVTFSFDDYSVSATQ